MLLEGGREGGVVAGLGLDGAGLHGAIVCCFLLLFFILKLVPGPVLIQRLLQSKSMMTNDD